VPSSDVSPTIDNAHDPYSVVVNIVDNDVRLDDSDPQIAGQL